MTEMFGEAWSPMSVPDLAPDDDDDDDKWYSMSILWVLCQIYPSPNFVEWPVLLFCFVLLFFFFGLWCC